MSTTDILTECNLREIVREVIATGHSPDPHINAQLVDQLIPDEQVRSACQQMLPGYVRDSQRGMRRDAIQSQKRSIGSNRFDDKTEAFKSFLTSMEYVPSIGAWKFVKDLTSDDVRSLADNRRQLAAENLKAAERYEALAIVMDKEGAIIVADLDVDTVARVLGD